MTDCHFLDLRTKNLLLELLRRGELQELPSKTNHTPKSIRDDLSLS